jgi:hypothetical protein
MMIFAKPSWQGVPSGRPAAQSATGGSARERGAISEVSANNCVRMRVCVDQDQDQDLEVHGTRRSVFRFAGSGCGVRGWHDCQSCWSPQSRVNSQQVPE